MAFRLKPRRRADKEVERIVRREIENILGVAGRVPCEEEEAVHDIRAHCKKIRSVLRLARPGMGDAVYRRENSVFRDVARLLTEVRDAQVRLATLDRLAAKSRRADDFSLVREAFQADYRAMREHVLERRRAFAHVEHVMEKAAGRAGCWHIGGKGRKMLRRGVRHVYRQGRHTFAAAVKHPTVAHLHEWRKQSKYLWYELKALALEHPQARRQSHRLSQLLGDDHDLAMLRQSLVADASDFGNGRVKKWVSLIDRRRNRLQKKAMRLGRRLYRKRPCAFVTHIGI